jgi:hypothetical protein
MKRFYRDLFCAGFLLALIAGCTLTGVRTSVSDDPATNQQAESSADEHLGDPTFTNEVVGTESIIPPLKEEEDEAEAEERKINEGAVVSREPEVPAAIEPEPKEEDSRCTHLLAGIDLYDQGKLRDARVELTAALNSNLAKEDEQDALRKLRSINNRIFLSTGPEGDLKVYRVKSGDTLARIANAHGTTWEMIQRVNGLTSTRIQVGQALKVLSGEFELVVRKERFVMDLLLDGQFIQRYEVGLGLGGSTPLGEFTIKNRIPRPADGSYPFGHEKHRLGTRWMGLEGETGYHGYGIHGCRPEQEAQIPGECSQGCVRMTNREVEELFDIVPVGTRVAVIRR